MKQQSRGSCTYEPINGDFPVDSDYGEAMFLELFILLLLVAVVVWALRS